MRDRMSGVVRALFADERVRFVLVGGVNTSVGFGLFAAFEWLRGDGGSYFVSLVASYAIAVVLAFFLHRHVTFRRRGRALWWTDFARFVSVYVVSLPLNALTLGLLVEVAHMSTLLGQAVALCITTVGSYVGHKWFSFRRSHDPDEASVGESS